MDLQINHLEKVLVANRGEIAVRLIRACAAVGIKSVSVYTEADSNSEHASLADEGVLLSGDNVKGYLDTLWCLTQTKLLSYYQIMLKATGGGGGMGLQVCNEESDIQSAFAMVKGRGESLFGKTGVFMEKYFPSSRHVEVQVFGNGEDVVNFGERECSIQRRHQKIIEECPSPYVHQRPNLRKRITECAVRYASKLKYKSAGTVEFLVDDSTGNFFFLEMNTRLQVEHGITELCYDVDLVALMLSQADWEKSGATGIPSEYLRSLQKDEPKGAAIECRIYAEVPHKNFAPSSGLLQAVTWPQGSGIRVDSWVKAGQNISPHYDPLLAKVMVHSESRETAITKMLETLATCVLQDPANNLQYLGAVVASDGFQRGETLTNYISKSFSYCPCGLDLISPGSFTTIQDFPGRVSIGHGVPRSGPMDNLSSRIANILVGNDPGTEVLEMTLSGPELLFHTPAVVSVCGAPMRITVDGVEKPQWSRLIILAGQTIKIASGGSAGCRSYLAVKGGFPEIALYLGSKSTTPSLNYGGMQGRQLRASDHIIISQETGKCISMVSEYSLPLECIPSFDITEIYCLHGPHDDDGFMTAADREMLYTSPWTVGHNSSRTGVRLVGPNPQWSRKDGGAGGAHPSNCFDYGYPLGGMNWGGDSPKVFSMDSPNLGGLICSTTVISSDLWRLGQLRPGDKVRLKPTTYDNALEFTHRVESYILSVKNLVNRESSKIPTLDLHLPPGETGAIYRFSLSEMFVPYGDSRTPYPRKAAFDLGNNGAGVNANNLQLGCDCLGHIKYFHTWLHTMSGDPLKMPNVVCCHEQDGGILWKHTNFRTNNAVVTRSRILVLQTIITANNYEYIFAFHFNQAAEITYEVRATGILSTNPIDIGDSVPYGTVVAPGVLAPYHQHLFSLRIDPAVDDQRNSLMVEESHAMPYSPPDEANPAGVGYITQKSIVENEAGLDTDITKNRVFKIINENIINPINNAPVSYKLVPHYSQMTLAHPTSLHAKRSEFGAHSVWVTKYHDRELFASGMHTMQSPGGEDGLNSLITSGKESVRNEDIVIWHTFGTTSQVP
ncbi:hypothetical protein N7540_012190, partial [Penicillium herquei]